MAPIKVLKITVLQPFWTYETLLHLRLDTYQMQYTLVMALLNSL